MLRVFEGFAGYGGTSFGLKHARIGFDVVGYSEIDGFASVLYNANHKDREGNSIKDYGDITKITPEHNKTRIVEPMRNGKEIVRKYSVDERFRLMGFNDGELDYADQSYSQLSKRAVNGWDVNLVGILLRHIWNQL